MALLPNGSWMQYSSSGQQSVTSLTCNLKCNKEAAEMAHWSQCWNSINDFAENTCNKPAVLHWNSYFQVQLLIVQQRTKDVSSSIGGDDCKIVQSNQFAHLGSLQSTKPSYGKVNLNFQTSDFVQVYSETESHLTMIHKNNPKLLESSSNHNSKNTSVPITSSLDRFRKWIAKWKLLFIATVYKCPSEKLNQLR